MTTVIAGTDTYGRVKCVEKTPVVTQFEMLQFFPLWPIQSMYYFGKGKEEFRGIPLVLFKTKREIHGLPLAKIDKASVVMAFLRAVLATVGLLASIMCVMNILMREPPGGAPDWFNQALYVTTGVIACLGGITYLVPLTPKRDRTIREYCGHVLGVAIDPAKITPQTASDMEAELSDIWKELSDIHAGDNAFLQYQKTICKLIQIRCKLAGKASSKAEEVTDQILIKLRDGYWSS